MKLEFDKEIDALLREGARRGRAAPAASVESDAGASGRAAHGGVRSTSPGAHLDADEQNAYAENSLPVPARTHYAAHLADCDDCRRSVTQLALAAGTPALLEQQATATATTAAPGSLGNANWRERVGAWFTPRAWLYAVPVLALLLVGAAAWMGSMRTLQGEVSVAQQQPQTKTQPAQPVVSETHHAPQDGNSNTAPTVGEGNASPASNSNAAPQREEVAAAGARESQGQPLAGVVIDGADAAPPPPATGAGTASAPVAPPVAAAAEMPMPLPTPEPAPQEVVAVQEAEKKAKVVQRADDSAKDVQRPGNYENNQPRERISGPRRNEQSRNVQRAGNAGISTDSADKNDVALGRPLPTPTPTAPTATTARRARQRAADGERDNRAPGDVKKSESTPAPKATAETRTVAGRKFRRAGGAWIDTAYQSSQAVTIIRRNSEQYRALVADEPELRRIGDALGGEVTVVWKGRVYRIR